MLFSLALGLLVFLAAREMFDPLTALLALGLFAFEPVLLANGALVTTDVPLACFFFASGYSFYRYVKKPSNSRLAVCAVATALAILTKHSGILVVPTLVLLACVEIFAGWFRPADGMPPRASDRWRRLREFALAFCGDWRCQLCLRVDDLWVSLCCHSRATADDPNNRSLCRRSQAHPLEKGVIGFMSRHHLLPEAYLYGWVDILLIPGMQQPNGGQ